METSEQLGDAIFMEELWWVLMLDATNPTRAQMGERYYLSEGGPRGCQRVLHDVQLGTAIPMLAINLEQLEGILLRFDHLQAMDEVLDIGEPHDEAWLVWMDKGGDQGVQEVWTYTKDPQEAEITAMNKLPRASPLLRASLETLRNARATLQKIAAGSWGPIWLDLRDAPRHLSAAQLLERKTEESF